MPATICDSPIFQPMRQRRFRQLWLANLLSNLGTWGQAFAAAWHVAALSDSAALTALVQTATWAPMLLCALPAGLLADHMPRPTLLLRSNAAMAVTAAAMAGLTATGAASATLVLALTFVLGVGNAFMLPAWQVSMSVLVARQDIAAVAQLNNLSYNVAALLGPCLGGLLFQWAGPAPLYLFNALSYCGLLWCYRQWQRDDAGARRQVTGPQGRPGPGLAGGPLTGLLAGITAARQLGRYRHLLCHAGLIFCVSTAFAALLPSLVREVQHGGAHRFGALMGALGGGAILASALLPDLRQRLPPRALLAGALLIYAAMLGSLGMMQSYSLQLLLIGCGGVAWSTMVTTMNGAALSAFPSSLRARTLSIYIFMVAAGQTAGGALWGQLALRYGVAPVMAAAGIGMLACAAAVWASDDFLEYQ